MNEIVLVGAHLDSWAAGAGATDDGAGVVIAMEAMRILRALDVKPRRTIPITSTSRDKARSGRARMLKEHLAVVPLDGSPEMLPEFMRRPLGSAVPKPEHRRWSAVYTLDAGGGNRGISTGNPATVQLFQEWLAPLRDLGVTTVRAAADCGGDCASFAQAGASNSLVQTRPARLQFTIPSHRDRCVRATRPHRPSSSVGGGCYGTLSHRNARHAASPVGPYHCELLRDGSREFRLCAMPPASPKQATI